MAEKNPMWKGDKVGYQAIHGWIKSRKLKPNLCELCKINPPYDLASKGDIYTRNLNDWMWICRRCHMLLDGRLVNLHKVRGDTNRVPLLSKM